MQDIENRPQNGAREFKNILLGILLLITLGLAAGLILKPEADKGAILNYDQCASSQGSRIQLSYPSVCVTKSGHRYVNTNQQQFCGRSGYAVAPNLCR